MALVEDLHLRPIDMGLNYIIKCKTATVPPNRQVSIVAFAKCRVELSNQTDGSIIMCGPAVTLSSGGHPTLFAIYDLPSHCRLQTTYNNHVITVVSTCFVDKYLMWGTTPTQGFLCFDAPRCIGIIWFVQLIFDIDSESGILHVITRCYFSYLVFEKFQRSWTNK